MCLFGGGGGGGQPQVIYKDAPIEPLPAPMPTAMASGIGTPTSNMTYADGPTDVSKTSAGTSVFKINRDPVASNDYQDQGLDSGLYY